MLGFIILYFFRIETLFFTRLRATDERVKIVGHDFTTHDFHSCTAVRFHQVLCDMLLLRHVQHILCQTILCFTMIRFISDFSVVYYVSDAPCAATVCASLVQNRSASVYQTSLSLPTENTQSKSVVRYNATYE